MAEGALARSRANIALVDHRLRRRRRRARPRPLRLRARGPYNRASRGAFRPGRPGRYAGRGAGGGGRDDDGDAVMAKEAKRGRRSGRSTATASSASPRRARPPRPATSPSTSTRRWRWPGRRTRSGVDLAVFPELNLSSYAVDDLFLQDAFLDAVEAGIARLATASAELAPVLRRRRAAAAQRPALQLRARDRARPHPRRRAEELPAQLPRILREALVRLRRRPRRAEDRGRRPERAVRHRPDLRRRATSPTSSSTSRFARIIGRRSRPRRWARWPAR